MAIGGRNISDEIGGRNISDEIGGRNISEAFLQVYFLNLSPSNVLHLVVGEKTFTMYSSDCHRKFI